MALGWAALSSAAAEVRAMGLLLELVWSLSLTRYATVWSKY